MMNVKMILAGAATLALVACSGGEKEPEMMPEEMPANQEELVPASDTADTMQATDAPEAKAGEPGSVAPEKKADVRVGTQESADAPIKSTSKKTANSSAPVVEPEAVVAPADADAPVKTTTKKKR